MLYSGEDIADRLWRGPDWFRPAAGGVLLGLLLLAVPELYGVGYPVVGHAVGGQYVLLVLLGLLAAKLLATSLTMWIGGSGGVFAPSLFMGAMLGSAYGSVVHRLLPRAAQRVSHASRQPLTVASRPRRLRPRSLVDCGQQSRVGANQRSALLADQRACRVATLAHPPVGVAHRQRP
ncbi:MAG: chloride channel protein [Solirubrobacterales bacterium]|nr:chloride channel protein [Solirubrobacterales bacterium]